MENDAQMKLRLPHELRETIAALAKQNSRSMNSEIVARLEKSIDDEMVEAMSEVATPAFIDQFAAKVEEIIKKYGVEYAFPDNKFDPEKGFELGKQKHPRKKIEPPTEPE
ncbi:Arc family DNA-binding protein [Massilia oculi]|uniref:Arc family DNA-binding protein n=1 Tax=Massilia oculi TaxID=945844 RepID=UPI001AAF3173|nr:Arc family DNA-binding protein [Massilia oculi]